MGTQNSRIRYSSSDSEPEIVARSSRRQHQRDRKECVQEPGNQAPELGSNESKEVARKDNPSKDNKPEDNKAEADESKNDKTMKKPGKKWTENLKTSQKRIDSIWKEISQESSFKALTVLPPSSRSTPVFVKRGNELLKTGYVCVAYDTDVGIYGFLFYRDGEWTYSIVDDKLFLKNQDWDTLSWADQDSYKEGLQKHQQPIDSQTVELTYRKCKQTGSDALFFAANLNQNETWVPLIEKAYAKAHGDYASLDGGYFDEACGDMFECACTKFFASDILNIDAFWRDDLSKINDKFSFGCSKGGYVEREASVEHENVIMHTHQYVVMDARELKDGTRLCKVRNPWGLPGRYLWQGAWSDGSKEMTIEAQKELNHTPGSDSAFWISYVDFLREFNAIDRVRRLDEQDWRSYQRWIGVEVPWNPAYSEKFHIKLTKQSPVVLVLGPGLESCWMITS